MQKYILPINLYLWSIAYFLLTVLLRWQLHPDLTILLYLLGSLIGLHLLEVLEVIFGETDSPFRTVFTQAVLTFVTFFVITSSGSQLGSGVVLFMNLRFFYLQFEEYSRTKSLTSWFGKMTLPLPEKNTRIYLYLLVGAMVFETLIFILV